MKIFQIIVLGLLFIFSQMSNAGKITSLAITGVIGPAMADYIVRGIDKSQQADLILIRMDTPGGLDHSMRKIVQAILTSKVPVVTFVSPSGARATSAGTYILYASTIAAMSPGTHLGAASPVNLGLIEEPEKKKSSVMDKKIMNDALGYIKTLAQLRNRNINFAMEAVLTSKTMTSSDAAKENVINMLATDENNLFEKLNGLTVTQDGRQIKLTILPATIQSLQPDWHTRFLMIITDPTIAYLLLLLGIYGIFFELWNPGFIAPGVIGAVSIMVALYALQLLPINYAGLTLIFLGIAFIIAEAHVPSFGILGIGGTVAFVLGSIFLIDTGNKSYQIAWTAISAMAFVNVILFIPLMGMIMKSRQKPLQHGSQKLVGAQGRTLNIINLDGQALIAGEIWRVQAMTRIESGKTIRVIKTDGLTLEVEEVSPK